MAAVPMAADVIHLVPVDARWPGAWDALKEYIERALVKGGADANWSIEDLEKEARERRIQLWGFVRDGALFGGMATQEQRYPKRRVVEVSFLTIDEGNEDAWPVVRDAFCDIARKAGLAAVVAGGRPGWEKREPTVKLRRVYEKRLGESNDE